MSYTFLDAYSSVQTAESTDIGGGVQRPTVAVANAVITSITGSITPYAQPDSFISGSTSSILQTSSVQVLSSPGVGLRNYITQVTVTNGSSVNGTFVRLLDGGGGPILYEGYAAVSGGGFALSFPVPLRQSSVTALFAANVSPSVVTVVSASGYKAP